MIKKILIVVFFLFVSLIYLHNLTRDIYSGDLGDLVTAAYVGGVAHPPGYPLFTFLGLILSRLPIPIPVVSKVGLISIFSSLLALIFYYKYTLKVSKSIYLGLLCTSILAFSYFFWLNAEIPEVFALNNFFIVILLYLAFQFFKSKKVKYLYFLAFFLGLSLTHHHTIILIFPALAYLIRKHLKIILKKKTIFLCLMLFLLGISVYLYVPIAASRNPVINWDSATNLKNFIHLVSRKDYGVVTLGKSQGIVPQSTKMIILKNYLQTIVSTYSFQVVFVFLLGLVYLFFKDRKLFFSLFVASLLTGPLFIFYSAYVATSSASLGILERFYTLSAVTFMFFVPFGFIIIKNFLNKKLSSPIFSYIELSYFFIVPIFLYKFNFPKTDLSKTQIGNELALDVFSTLPKNSVFFATGDTITFNTWYLRYVLKERADIEIINPPGVGNNIYLDKEINEYYKKNPKVSLRDIVSKTFEVIRSKKPIFTTQQIPNVSKDALLMPKGLIFELVDKKNLPSEEDYLKNIEDNLKRLHIKRRDRLNISELNFITPEIPLIYSNAFVRVGDFLIAQYK
ncbi:DUF2723 domain-containing protein, partial [Candidatus Roizmanbacteria bacterium]|nr:DUF2723 domain-containing protein [Candidatus Roizmanbacteria bacterium]